LRRGRRRPVSVAGMTSPHGRILLDASAVTRMSDDELLALLFHEYGHRFLGISSDAMGERLLDAAGTAIAWKAVWMAVPDQSPPPLNDGKAFCNGSEPLLQGVLADLGVTLPDGPSQPGLSAEGILRSPVARQHFLRDSFQTYLHREILEAEERFLLARFAEGDGAESVLSSIVGTDEYSGDRSFVWVFFGDFYGREPAARELQESAVDLGRFDRASFALAAFRNSKELQERLVRRWYRSYLNRAPSQGEINVAVRRLSAGQAWEEAQAEIFSGPEYAALQKKRLAGCARKHGLTPLTSFAKLPP